MKKLLLPLVIIFQMCLYAQIVNDTLDYDKPEINTAIEVTQGIASDIAAAVSQLNTSIKGIQDQITALQQTIDNNYIFLNARIDTIKGGIIIIQPVTPDKIVNYLATSNGTSNINITWTETTPGGVDSTSHWYSLVNPTAQGFTGGTRWTQDNSSPAVFTTALRSTTIWFWCLNYKDGIPVDSNADTARVIVTTPGTGIEGPLSWKVDPQGTGAAPHTWAGAWSSLGQIVWGNVLPGDTIFISGEGTSQTYAQGLTIGKSGTYGHLITVRPGFSAGHNGTVTITGKTSSNEGILILDKKYIKLEKLNVSMINNMDEGIYIRGMTPGATQSIYVDSCQVICQNVAYTTWCMRIDGAYPSNNLYTYSDSIYVRYGYYENTRVTPSDIQCDALIAQWSQNLWYIGNTIKVFNDYNVTTGNQAHNDCIAMDNAVANVTIKNNICYNLQQNGMFGQGMILNAYGYLKVYNNVIITPNFRNNGGQLGTTIGFWNPHSGGTYEFYNNTFIGGSSAYIFKSEGSDLTGQQAVKFKNNIIYATANAPTNGGRIRFVSSGPSFTNPTWANIDGNLYGEFADYNGSVLLNGLPMSTLNTNGAENNQPPSSARWNATNSTIFLDAVNYDYDLKAGSPALLKGVYLGIPELNYDIEGVERTNPPDIGAYQYSLISGGGDPATPTILNSTTTIPNFGNVEINTTSAEQTYTVSGTDLDGDITIDAPTGFEISEASGSGFSSQIVLSEVVGTVTTTTIYVHFIPTLEQAYSGNITHTSLNATTKNVAVSGTGIYTPAGYPNSIVLADFEEGVGVYTPDWSRTKVTSPHSLTIGTGYKYHGTYGLKIGLGQFAAVAIDTTIVERSFTNTHDTLSGYFFFRVDSSMSTSCAVNNTDIEIFGLYDGLTLNDWIFLFGFKTNASNNFAKLLLECNDGGAASTDYLMPISKLVDTWHKIKWIYYSGATTPNGGVVIYLDDNPTPIYNQRTHSTTTINSPVQIKFGCVDNNSTFALADGNSFFYLDDIIVSWGIMGDFTGF